MPKVRHLNSPAGNPNKAQEVLIYADETETFVSYGSPVVTKYPDGSVLLHKHWNASQTTNKYRNQFLGEKLADTRRKIADGTYMLAEDATDD